MKYLPLVPSQRLLPFLLLFLLVGCDALSGSDDPVDEGVDLEVLFAPPTGAEINDVLNEWNGRDVSAQGVTEVAQSSVIVGENRLTVRVLSHLVGEVRHYGAVITPLGAQPGSLPVLVYAHGGDAGVSIDDEVLLVLAFLADLSDQFVVVVPSFRDESIRFEGETYVSDGPASPWDRDVDDALALLNAALQTTLEADPTRIGIVGFSRGAGVAMLMGIRDPRIDRIVSFFGPTDFYGAFVQEVVDEILQGMPRNLPGLDYLSDTYIMPLQEGAITMAQARKELTRRSSVLFADRLPPLQVHHGTADTVVPVSQAESMIETMARLGRGTPVFEAYLYEGGTHNPLTLPESLDRTSVYLEPLFQAVLAAQ